VGQDLLIVEASRSHSDTPHSVGLLWTSDQLDPRLSDKTQYSQGTDILAPRGIRTRIPSRRAAADPRLRTRGHWDGPLHLIALTDLTFCRTYTRSSHSGDHPTKMLLLYVLRLISSYQNGSTKDKPMIKHKSIKHRLILAKYQINCSTKSLIALYYPSRRSAKHKTEKPQSTVRIRDHILYSGSLIDTSCIE